ncbi:hypothetical protein SOM11_04640 [Frigoribacterium sp. CFBP9039]|nr:hypothetical protein [Frigoribacterium sp. CFBP9039]MDY0945270.1 hypothetical protein [Frigoribacterium sp. CFBP9039]
MRGVVKAGVVTVSMRAMSAGDGYKYLPRTVAAGDGDHSLSTPLTRYYAEEGSPPGHWLASDRTVVSCPVTALLSLK